MAYGVWVTNDQETMLMDQDGKKIALVEARRRARNVLETKEKDEILVMLLDRLDTDDLMGLIADIDHRFTE